MGGINSVKTLQAMINALSGVNTNSNKKPAAPWRPQHEFQKLVKESKCTRCTSKSHKSRVCLKYSAAKNPNSIAQIRSKNEIEKNLDLLDVTENDLMDDEMSGEE